MFTAEPEDTSSWTAQQTTFTSSRTKFEGKKADDILEWSCKLRASLSIYNRAIFNMQGQERPSVTNDSQATARTAWDVANHAVFSILSL